MNLPAIIKTHFDELTELCERFRVDKLFAFGSVVTNRFDPQASDLDLIVELEAMPPVEKWEMLIGLWDALEKLFGLKVDLLTDQPIKNPYLRQEVEKTKRLIYDHLPVLKSELEEGLNMATGK